MLSVTTALPWLTSVLLTDIFTGFSLLALYLLIFRPTELKHWERITLFAVIAFSAASHSATLAMLVAVVGAAALAAAFVRAIASARQLIYAAAAIKLGAVMLLTTNFALSGQFAWTPGGYGIAFGRMLQDGIVARYLKDHCPEAKLKLCPYRNELPPTADEFLWDDGVFIKLGRFNGLGDEMRTIVLHSLAEYPGQQIETALKATAQQLVLVATGAGVHNQLRHTYEIIERFIPAEVSAMCAARQQRGELDFSWINRLRVPAALLSAVLMLALLARFWRIRRTMSGSSRPVQPSLSLPTPSYAAPCRERTIGMVLAWHGYRLSSS